MGRMKLTPWRRVSYWFLRQKHPIAAISAPHRLPCRTCSRIARPEHSPCTKTAAKKIVAQEMRSRGEPREAKQGRAEPHAAPVIPPRPWRRHHIGERRKIKPERAVAGYKGAIALALIGRHQRRRKMHGSAEFDDIPRPSSAPVIFKNTIGDKTRPEQQTQKQKQPRLGVESQNRPALTRGKSRKQKRYKPENARSGMSRHMQGIE